MTPYTLLKSLHVSCVALSLALFLLRGGMALRSEQPPVPPRWLRVLPHIVDTALLLSALALAVIIRQYPFVNGWLTAKFAAPDASLIGKHAGGVLVWALSIPDAYRSARLDQQRARVAGAGR